MLSCGDPTLLGVLVMWGRFKNSEKPSAMVVVKNDSQL